jgi:hypothetical protein
LNEKRYENKDFIFSGHSLGGAVATITAILAILEETKKAKIFGTLLIRSFNTAISSGVLPNISKP